jgi:predicted metal-dependent hydrolase
MASKGFTLDGIGDITVYKRRGTTKINLRIVSGKVRVTQPTWLPYASGVQFARSNRLWINKQQLVQPLFTLRDGMLLGKTRSIRIEQGDTLRTRITETELIVYIPSGFDIGSRQVLDIVLPAIKRALKKEAEAQLPERVALCAERYDFNYTSVRCKSMRSRWGSCTNQKEITLNIFLMMTPWELIDYVIVHELVHTVHLHHGPDFWEAVGAIVPDYKQRRKDLKAIQATIAPLQ